MSKVDKKLLILDLDETLIYATEVRLPCDPDFVVGQYSVYKRPYLESFADYCFANFEVAVWTTSTESYASEIVEHIFGGERKLRFLWSRDRCTWIFDEDSYERIQIKKLEKVRRLGFRADSIIVVDDTPSVWKLSYGNLVKVDKFEGDPADDTLNDLPRFLDLIKEVPNIRAVEKRNWRSRIKG